jgi:oxepin-CoA hydrolase/3-oxo-5,6-dehydrosuberyl-CoA semialdehyde dehydrogenase
MPNFKSPILDREKLPDLINGSLDEAIAEFRKEWAAFNAFFSKNPAATPANAVFGPLTEDEWRRFHFKHFVHHLSQFGVTTNEAQGLEAIR